MTFRNTFCGRTRREFLWQTGAGFTGLGLVDLLSRDGFFKDKLAIDRSSDVLLGDDGGPLAPKPPHHAPKAKACIFLFMYGGPSHVDTFDYKPKLYPLDGKTIEIKTKGRGGSKTKGRVVGWNMVFSPSIRNEPSTGGSSSWVSFSNDAAASSNIVRIGCPAVAIDCGSSKEGSIAVAA